MHLTAVQGQFRCLQQRVGVRVHETVWVGAGAAAGDGGALYGLLMIGDGLELLPRGLDVFELFGVSEPEDGLVGELL